MRVLPVHWAPGKPIVLTDFVQRPGNRRGQRASSLPPSLERPTKVSEVIPDERELDAAFGFGLDNIFARFKVLGPIFI